MESIEKCASPSTWTIDIDREVTPNINLAGYGGASRGEQLGEGGLGGKDSLLLLYISLKIVLQEKCITSESNPTKGNLCLGRR